MKKENFTENNKPVYIIIGTRAQLIKTAPVMKELQDRGIAYIYIYTGQHKETVKDLQNCFGLKNPDIDLSIKKFEASNIAKFFLWWLKMLSFFFRPKKIFKYGRGIAVTHGDTVTCWWGALLGKLAKNKVAHLESGLRSFNIFHPFPEEINRLITFCFTDYYFCPNEWAVNNLKNFKGEKINIKENTLLDAVRLAMKQGSKMSFDAPEEQYFVLSMHRFENIYNKKRLLSNIELIEQIAEKYLCIFILHPVTREKLIKAGLMPRLEANSRIKFRPRSDFISFIDMVVKSEFMITDGGSNQEELCYLGHPCLLLRKKTERIEGLGKNIILSNYDNKIIFDFVDNYRQYRKSKKEAHMSPSKIVVDHLLSFSQN